MKSAKAPTPPDPVTTAAAQTKSNQDTAQYQQGLNLIDQVTPLGSLTYTQTDPGDTSTNTPPHYVQTTALSQSGQESFDLQQQVSKALNNLALSGTSQVADAFNKPIDYSNLPAIPNDPNGNAARDALYAQATSRLDPQFETGQKELETQLNNKGIKQGSDAWNSALDQFGRNKNDAYGSAERSSVAGGASYAQQLLSNALSARQQGISEADYERELPINEVSTLLNGGQVSQPTFGNTVQTGVNATNTAQITQNSFADAFQNYNAAMTANSAAIGAIAGVAGSALGGWATGGFK